MVDGADTAPGQRLRPAAPAPEGPLHSSGAAADAAPTQPSGSDASADARVPEPQSPAARPAPAGLPAAPPPSRGAEPEAGSDSGPPSAAAAPVGAIATATGETTAATTTDETATAATATTNGETATGGRGRRIPLSPRRTAVATARAVSDWSRGPRGRLALPALLLLLLVSAAGAGGALLVPATAQPLPKRVAEATDDPDFTAPPLAGTGPPPTAGVPAASPTASPSVPAGFDGRPADVLAGWAEQTGERVSIPPVAMQAYGYAELVLHQTKPNCRLTWTTLAAIGLVESNHGRANGATLAPDGQALPAIIGLPLDGAGGRQRIADTDGGLLDGDRTYDRAVGPMQFIPSTWAQSGVDADNDGVKNPNDIDDAALAAANYLCGAGRDLSTGQDWWRAILSYNDVRSYAQAVFDAANNYGTSSRT